MSGVAVIGVGQTPYERSKPHQSIPEMVLEAVELALKDARISMEEIEGVVTASVDLWDGRTASNIQVTEVVGAVMKPEARVAGDGLLAAIHAAMTILSGAYGTVLVVAHCKMSEGEHWSCSNWAVDPIYQQTLGVDFLSAAGLQARAYRQRYGVGEAHWTRVVEKNRLNAERNRLARVRANDSAAEIPGPSLVADPLRALDLAPVTDGACVVVLANPERAEALGRSKPVTLLGFGYASEAHYLGDRDLAEPRSLRAASREAHAMAKITDPRHEIQVVECAEAFSYQELLWCEGLGLCAAGHGGRLLDEGVTVLGGELPVNPSGGMLGGSPFVVAGLARLAEAVLQVRGEADGHQVKGVSRALAHGSYGPAGQHHSVAVVGA
ncbi:MAG: thiolase family protein [Candidatus Methylomirabilia bacterium]